MDYAELFWITGLISQAFFKVPDDHVIGDSKTPTTGVKTRVVKIYMRYTEPKHAFEHGKSSVNKYTRWALIEWNRND